MPKQQFTFVDNSGEQSSIGLNMPPITIANVEAYTSGVPLNLYNRMLDAIQDLTLGTLQVVNTTAERVLANEEPPADPNAQRERKAVVTYRDDVTKIKHSVEIPIFNMTGSQIATDELDITTPEWVEFISVFEEGYKSHLGNDVVVISAKHVGRSL